MEFKDKNIKKVAQGLLNNLCNSLFVTCYYFFFLFFT